MQLQRVPDSSSYTTRRSSRKKAKITTPGSGDGHLRHFDKDNETQEMDDDHTVGLLTLTTNRIETEIGNDEDSEGSNLDVLDDIDNPANDNDTNPANDSNTSGKYGVVDENHKEATDNEGTFKVKKNIEQSFMRLYKSYIREQFFDTIKFVPNDQWAAQLMEKACRQNVILSMLTKCWEPDMFLLDKFVGKRYRWTYNVMGHLRHNAETMMKTRYHSKYVYSRTKK